MQQLLNHTIVTSMKKLALSIILILTACGNIDSAAIIAMSPNQVSIEYSEGTNQDQLLTKAQEHCGKYGSRAKKAADNDLHVNWRWVAIFDCVKK